MDNEFEKFDKVWNRYIDLIGAKLLEKLQQGQLTMAMANMIISECNDKWLTKYDIIGKWLFEYAEENQQKAEMIKNIIETEIKFTQEINKKSISNIMQIAIPVTVGLIGGGISSIFTQSLWVKATSTILPAVLAYPTVNTYNKSHKCDVQKDIVDGYISQLEKYHTGIKEIIES